MQTINFDFNRLNIIKLFFVFSFFFLLSSCYHVNESKPVVPDILLSSSQMVEILTEIQITEAGFSINKNRIKAKELKPEYYDKILHQYGITIQQLKENIDYYHDSPKVLEEIYEKVLANLSKIQSDVLLEKEKIEEKRIADSITMVTDSINLVIADSLAKKVQNSY